MTLEDQINRSILERLRNRDQETLKVIYKRAYPMVEKYIVSNSGSKADAEDIFQDAFYLFIKKAEQADFSLTSKPDTFLFGISRNLWLKQLTKPKINAAELDAEYKTEEDEQDTSMLHKVKRMKACLLLLGEPCRTIIEQFYFLGTSMKKIAELLNYTNANNAKNQKYKCFVRLKKLVLEQSNL